MAQHPHVPKFGDWGSEENVPYTVFFEKARKGRGGGKMINPNDPQENPDMFPNIASVTQDPPPKTRVEPAEPRQAAVRPVDERPPSRHNDDRRQFANPAAQHNENMQQRAGDELAHQRPGRQIANKSVGSDQSFDPHYQAKLQGKGSASPAWEGKNSYDSNHGTPGRVRGKPGNLSDDKADRVTAVPKFGEWNENDPASADNFTHIFNRVRDERHSVPENPGSMGNIPAYSNTRNQAARDSDHSSCCCFPWGSRK